MSYFLNVGKDRPISVYPLEDLAGRKSHPLVPNYAGQSIFASNLEIKNITFSEFSNNAGFSLEAWIKPVKIEAPGAIFSHEQIDGLYADASGIGFKLSFTNSDAVVYANVEHNQVYHVVGTFNGFSMYLYINGSLAGTYSLTDEQLVDDMVFNTNFVIGKSAGVFEVFADNYAAYNYPITQDTVIKHYNYINEAPSSDFNTKGSSSLFQFSDINASLIESKVWNRGSDWVTGRVVDISLLNNNLESILDDELVPLAGVWMAGFAVPRDLLFEVAKISWIGSGDFTVEASEDLGETWVQCLNNAVIPFTNIESFFVRVNFLAGTESVLNSLAISAYEDATIKDKNNSRVAQYTNGVILGYENQIQQKSLTGLNLTNGFLDITVNSLEILDNFQSVEFWAKFDSPTGVILSHNGNEISYNNDVLTISPNLTLYVNGALYSAGAFRAGEWCHFIIASALFDSALSTNIGGTGLDATLGPIAMYNAEPNIELLYKSYFGVETLFVYDEAISVNEIGFSLVSNEWTAIAVQ